MKKPMLRLPGVLLALCLIATPAAAAPAEPARDLAGGWWNVAVDLWWQVTGWWDSAVSGEATTGTLAPIEPDDSLRAYPDWDPNNASSQLESSPTLSPTTLPEGEPSS
ncbi:MAG TPA: hypothetical protein VHM02_12155 [Thermoanaerobaculia bacterium]|nr:hypothetical protein [Thermoanaerobaculia bacterium]